MEDNVKLTTSAGAPIAEGQNSRAAARAAADPGLIEKLAHQMTRASRSAPCMPRADMPKHTTAKTL